MPLPVDRERLGWSFGTTFDGFVYAEQGQARCVYERMTVGVHKGFSAASVTWRAGRNRHSPRKANAAIEMMSRRVEAYEMFRPRSLRDFCVSRTPMFAAAPCICVMVAALHSN
jgi:hypothetical protein